MINPISKFLFLLTFSSCFSEPVNVDVPYSSGGIIVRRYQFNTKNFSNGLRVDFPYKMTGTAESKERMIGIAFDGFENAGYKYVQSADYGLMPPFSLIHWFRLTISSILMKVPGKAL